MKHQAGFTLLEMLAALTLMAVCSCVLLVAFGQSARSLAQVARSDRLTQAALTLLD
ncbi:type II secretion system protein, partial [Pseudomonas urmiensis]|uniref:type II secretion system protein n=1 Tax=Pseudomonas urmiensis TaxID=2745493 RepID=UPI0034D507F0